MSEITNTLKTLYNASTTARHKTGVENHGIVAKFEKYFTDNFPQIIQSLEDEEAERATIARQQDVIGAARKAEIHLDGLSILGVAQTLPPQYRHDHAEIHQELRAALSALESEE